MEVDELRELADVSAGVNWGLRHGSSFSVCRLSFRILCPSVCPSVRPINRTTRLDSPRIFFRQTIPNDWRPCRARRTPVQVDTHKQASGLCHPSVYRVPCALSYLTHPERLIVRTPPFPVYVRYHNTQEARAVSLLKGITATRAPVSQQESVCKRSGFSGVGIGRHEVSASWAPCSLSCTWCLMSNTRQTFGSVIVSQHHTTQKNGGDSLPCYFSCIATELAINMVA